MRINGKIDDKIVVLFFVEGYFAEWKDGYYEKKKFEKICCRRSLAFGIGASGGLRRRKTGSRK